jgi:hypothetical protein
VNISFSTETDVPEIGRFDFGSQTSLGLETESDGSKWYLVVNNPQDYENTNQRYYRFFVLVAGGMNDVELNIRNLDDEIPYFILPDSTRCQIRVSNALNKPHSLHIITD